MENHAIPAARKRAGWLKRTCRAAALKAFLAFPLASTSCSMPAHYVPEHQEVRNGVAITAISLGLKKGESKLHEVEGMLRKKGITNMAKARGLDAKDQGVTIDALTGDNMLEVLLFRNLAFDKALPIGADYGTATRMDLHVTKTEGANAVIIVSPDIARKGWDSIIVLLDRFPPKRYFITVSVSHFPDWAGGRGMADPKMNGGDLGGTGVTLVARGTDGYPWENALIVRCDDKQLMVTPVSMQKVLGCGCLAEWFWKTKK